MSSITIGEALGRTTLGPLLSAHVAVRDLLKRLYYLETDGAHPQMVEIRIDGPPRETLDRPIGVREIKNGPTVIDMHYWTPLEAHVKKQPVGRYQAFYHALTKQVLGRVVAMQATSVADLWKMASVLADKIDAADTTGKEHDWYPNGWRDAYDMARGKGPKAPAASVAAGRSAPAQDWRSSVLDAINYVASTLGCSEDAVLKRIHRTRKTLRKGDDKLAVALLSESARIPGHEDAAG